MTTTAGKWFEIDSRKGQVYLVGAATRELAFEYHDKGYIALEANLGFEDGRIISFSQGGNTVTATDDENGFSEGDIGKYIYTGDGWHKILSVSDATIIGHGTNLFNVQDAVTVSDGVTVDGDGWITFTANNSAGSNVIYRNYYTAASDALKAGHEYLIIVEVAEMSVFGGNAVIRPISRSSEANQTQFDGAWSMASNSPVGTYVKKMRTLDDFSGATYMLRTDVLFYAGASGVVKIRLTVADEDPFVSIDNAQGQIESVVVEAGCVAQQAGTGDPSPTNIRAISGRESVEVQACGKNLIDTSLVSDEEKNGITVTRNPDGSIRLEGTSTANLFINLKIHGGTIFRNIESDVYVDAMNSPKTYGGYTAKDVCIEQRPTDTLTRVYLYITSGTNLDKTYYPQLELGSTATAYEAYTPMGGGTVTPTEPLYGLPEAMDSVDISVDGGVSLTRRTKLVTMDGANRSAVASTMPCASGAYAYVVSATGALEAEGFPALCSHFTAISKDEPTSQRTAGTMISGLTSTGVPNIWFFSDKETAAEFNEWLAAQSTAGTPVTLVYELATPTTEMPAAVDPIEPQTGEVNVFTDADSLNITLYKTENNRYASVTGSFSQAQNGFASALAQMNEISISGEDVELTKLEIDYVPQVR